ncbi:hypothetical protein [Rosettibacter firmus]|uniref:hypothetical protein n=1 Tax=Rosettibacter firmus TaxID=3111522 RepID=UPI00336BD646
MAKQLFKNYTYHFNKNEKKLLETFCKTLLKQISGDEKFYGDIRAFNSILDKLSESTEEIKFTKEEKTKLVFRLKENVEHLEKQIKKSGFIKRWLLKSVYTQYKNLLENHFTD